MREAIVDYAATRVYDGVECTVKVDGLKTPKCEKCGQVAPDTEALEEIEHAFDIERQQQAATRKSA